jgi:type II secretory pathway component PulK
MTYTRKRTEPNGRSASVLVCVLACMAVATALVVATTRSALQARREIRMQRQLRQVEFVLEAGIDRAARQLSAESQYSGETWTLSEATVPELGSAQVVIEVSPQDVQVVARLPATGPVVVQRSYTFPINRVVSLNKE